MSGVYLKRLKGKKTPDERKEYARRHEGILLAKEKAISVKLKDRLAKQKYKEKVWQEQLEQMQDVLTQTKKLTKKDERQVGDLLHQNFPEVTPPPSDHSSISSLDSELTSDTSDDEIHTNQGVGAKSRRIMCRLKLGSYCIKIFLKSPHHQAITHRYVHLIRNSQVIPVTWNLDSR